MFHWRIPHEIPARPVARQRLAARRSSAPLPEEKIAKDDEALITELQQNLNNLYDAAGLRPSLCSSVLFVLSDFLDRFRAPEERRAGEEKKKEKEKEKDKDKGSGLFSLLGLSSAAIERSPTSALKLRRPSVENPKARRSLGFSLGLQATGRPKIPEEENSQFSLIKSSRGGLGLQVAVKTPSAVGISQVPPPSSISPLHARLSSPERRKFFLLPADEAKKELEQKQRKAAQIREAEAEKVREKLRLHSQRQESVEKRKSQKIARLAVQADNRLESASVKHEEFVEEIRRKAESENQKVKEVAFITEQQQEARQIAIKRRQENVEQRRREAISAKLSSASALAAKQEAIKSRRLKEKEERQALLDQRLLSAMQRREEKKRKTSNPAANSALVKAKSQQAQEVKEISAPSKNPVVHCFLCGFSMLPGGPAYFAIHEAGQHAQIEQNAEARQRAQQALSSGELGFSAVPEAPAGLAAWLRLVDSPLAATPPLSRSAARNRKKKTRKLKAKLVEEPGEIQTLVENLRLRLDGQLKAAGEQKIVSIGEIEKFLEELKNALATEFSFSALERALENFSGSGWNSVVSHRRNAKDKEKEKPEAALREFLEKPEAVRIREISGTTGALAMAAALLETVPLLNSAIVRPSEAPGAAALSAWLAAQRFLAALPPAALSGEFSNSERCLAFLFVLVPALHRLLAIPVEGGQPLTIFLSGALDFLLFLLKQENSRLAIARFLCVAGFFTRLPALLKAQPGKILKLLDEAILIALAAGKERSTVKESSEEFSLAASEDRGATLEIFLSTGEREILPALLEQLKNQPATASKILKLFNQFAQIPGGATALRLSFDRFQCCLVDCFSLVLLGLSGRFKEFPEKILNRACEKNAWTAEDGEIAEPLNFLQSLMNFLTLLIRSSPGLQFLLGISPGPGRPSVIEMLGALPPVGRCPGLTGALAALCFACPSNWRLLDQKPAGRAVRSFLSVQNSSVSSSSGGRGRWEAGAPNSLRKPGNSPSAATAEEFNNFFNPREKR